MKKLLLVSVIALLIAGCAAYKELEPEPPISFLEAGYIELLDDDEKFELDEGSKYFIRFPQPDSEGNYLVLSFDDKSGISSYLTRAFDDGEGAIIRMPDESEETQTTSVYAVDQSVPVYYWVIEEVRRDLVLDMTYRYVARWRYKFEKKHQAFEEILTDNTQSDQILRETGVTVTLDEIDYAGEIGSVHSKSERIKQVQDQLHEIEAILPPDIINSEDPAYKDYVSLKERIDEQLAFQKDYKQTMQLLQVIAGPQTDIDQLVTRAEDYNTLLTDRSAYPAAFYQAVTAKLEETLPQISPYYQSELQSKRDAKPINVDLQPLLKTAEAHTILVADPLNSLNNFITTFNQRAAAAQQINDGLEALDQELMTGVVWPDNTYYYNKRGDLSRLKYKLPPSERQSFGDYQSYRCVDALNQLIRGLRNTIASLDKKLQRAENLVPQINRLRAQKNYGKILALLNQHNDLDFMKAQYAQLDDLLLKQQSQLISEALAVNAYQRAEFDMRALAREQNFLNPGVMIPRRNKLVKAYEDSIYKQIERNSLNAANQLIEDNTMTLSGIDSLYRSQTLYPAYTFTFSSAAGGADQKNQRLQSKMTELRTVTFPTMAIEALYRSFTNAIHQNGVEKARAIVAHGANYRGDDRKIKNLIAECDPTASKWLTKPKQFRKIFALPVTSNIGGSNQYMAKINLQIPSEARFPVFDVNVKLPQEVAKHAGNRQWYDQILFNGKVLKNEGRFSITAPDPDNDYIAQITPLQVNKTGNNVVEIRFNYDAFKVLEISVMAQKPIIKKN